MKDIKTQIPLTITILSIAFFQMGMVALAPVVAALTRAFPGTTDLTAQLATTFLNLIQVLVSFFSGRISRVIGRRRMAALGLFFYFAVAILGKFCSVALWLVFVWSGLMGIGNGLFVPTMTSVLIICYGEKYRPTVTGWQSATVNIGGLILSLLTGFLASKIWNNAYLAFLLTLPAIILALRYFPSREDERILEGNPSSGIRSKVPLRVILASLETFFFGVIYFTFSTNISLLLAEKSYDATALAGTVTACFMGGGVVCGLLFKKVSFLLKSYTHIAAFALVALSYLLIYLTDSLTILFLCAFVGGGSLSFIFPYLLLTVGGSVDPSLSVITSSLIISVAPNLGSFVSPMIVTNTSLFLWGEGVRQRFLTSFLIALLCIVVLLFPSLKKSLSPNKSQE